MWVNPKYAGQHSASDSIRPAPQDNGERLATIPRGPTEELRVSLDSYEGRPYVGLRIWSLGQDGCWWPTKKGCSVRIKELEQVARALMLALRLVEGQGQAQRSSAPARRAAPPRGHAPGYAQPRGELPGLEAPNRDLDELADGS